jgi:hypothetical protein
MKRIGILSAMLVLLVFLNSCLTTLHPIFTPADLVYKPELIGTWKIGENKEEKWAEIIRLVQADPRLLPGKTAAIKDKGYLITYKDSANTISERYIAFLARIGKHLYFDYYPADLPVSSKMDEFYQVHFVKMHTPYRLELQKEGGFKLSRLESGYMNELIEQKKIRIRHEKKEDEGIVITAPTSELQQYILKYGDDPEAYSGEKISFTKTINPKLY